MIECIEQAAIFFYHVVISVQPNPRTMRVPRFTYVTNEAEELAVSFYGVMVD